MLMMLGIGVWDDVGLGSGLGLGWIELKVVLGWLVLVLGSGLDLLIYLPDFMFVYVFLKLQILYLRLPLTE